MEKPKFQKPGQEFQVTKASATQGIIKFMEFKNRAQEYRRPIVRTTDHGDVIVTMPPLVGVTTPNGEGIFANQTPTIGENRK